MAVPPSKDLIQISLSEPSTENHSMEILPMRASPMLPSPMDMFRGDRTFRDSPLKTRLKPSRHERIELPSIRQAVPEIQQSARPELAQRVDSVNHSSRAVPGKLIIPPERVRSPARHKRRRLSNDDDQDLESRLRNSTPRYPSPPRHYSTKSTNISPTSGPRQSSGPTDIWPLSVRNSPRISARGSSRALSPPLDSRSEWRPTLPNLPSLTFDRGAPQPQRTSDHWSEYLLDSTRAGALGGPPTTSSSFEPLPSARQSTTSTYGYQQPRGQPYPRSTMAHHLYQDRSPFSGSHQPVYPPGNFPYPSEMSESGGDGKKRKRRGNLPKETTDKLRAWFVAHLVHPYPSEEQKQALMAETGLQMNQISNWFINARRRQLPAMINNARAESVAMSAGGEALQGEGASDDGEDGERRSSAGGDSEGEGSRSEEDYHFGNSSIVPPTQNDRGGEEASENNNDNNNDNRIPPSKLQSRLGP